MSEAKIEIHTEGGPVITGGTFTGVEFVAQKYVYKNNDNVENEELKMKNEEFSSFGGEADILHSSFPKGSSFPSLSTPLALEVMERMVSAGVLNEDWQPQGLSNAEKGVLASCLATRLDIAHVWQTFSALWGMKPETLRTAFNKGMEQRKTAAFLERVKKVMKMMSK